MSKSSLLKEQRKEIKKLEKLIWFECRRIIKIRFGDTCYTCKKECTSKNRQTGHCFNKKWCGLRMKYDLRLLAPQCYYCNINLGSNGATFFSNLIIENGVEYSMKLANDVVESKKEIWTPEKKISFLTNLLKEYRLIIN